MVGKVWEGWKGLERVAGGSAVGRIGGGASRGAEVSGEELLELDGDPGFDDGPDGGEGQGAEMATPAAPGFGWGGLAAQDEGGKQACGEGATQPGGGVVAQRLEDAGWRNKPLSQDGGLSAQAIAGSRAEANQVFDLRGVLRVSSHS